MARIKAFNKNDKERKQVHEVIDCTYYTFKDTDGKTYLQLDTHGSKARAIPGKVSQSIQLDEEGARALFKLLKETFPNF